LGIGGVLKVGLKHLGMALAALAAATPAQAEWREATSKHFVIYSEDSEKSVREFATRLERFDAALRTVRGLGDPEISPGNRLTVFVVGSMGAVRKLYGKGGGNVGGFYMGRVDGSYAITPRNSNDGDDFEQIVLLHEYGHHFMLQNFPAAYPAWLIEGFAEFNSTARFEKDGGVGLGLPANHRAYGLLVQVPIKLTKLLTSSVGDLRDDEKDGFYGRGWLLTHYLTLHPSRKGQLSAYLALINKGTESLAAAKQAFGDLDTLDRDLTRYIRQHTMSYLKLGADRIVIKPIAVRTLSAGDSAVMDVRIRSKRGVDKAAAEALLPLARKAAAPYPKDALAQVTLAEAAFDAKQYAEAEAAADRALAADPKSVEALVYKGRIKMVQAIEGKGDAATWREVRKWFLAANKVEVDDPEPLALFYQSFLAAGVKPTPNATLALEQALGLVPQDPSLRWMLARQKLQDGKADEARFALAPVAFDPHGGPQAKAASTILEKLASGGPKAALEALEAMGQDQAASEGSGS
jgi:tetratricopeptide (TPR) repeat protein